MGSEMCIRDRILVDDGLEVAIQAVLEGVEGGGADDVFWETVPNVDDAECKAMCF